jgi:hypothetical protein
MDAPLASSPAINRVPQFPQKRAPRTIGAPQVEQPMREPQLRQNFVSGGFSVEHVAQITGATVPEAPR